MQGVKAVFPIFLLFLLISFLILLFFQNPLSGVLQQVTLPIQKWVFSTQVNPDTHMTPQEQLEAENNQLRVELAQMQEIKKDDQALHDQFQTTTPASQKLLPANVLGVAQNTLLIDKGGEDNIHLGDVVVIKDNLIGKISRITPHISVVTLLSDSATSFTAEDTNTSASGIVKSFDGGNIILANVILSDKLTNNDIVMTKGDRDLQGNGYPPGLVVGKIVSVDREASSLFQAAKIQSLVDLSKTRIIFIVTQL